METGGASSHGNIVRMTMSKNIKTLFTLAVPVAVAGAVLAWALNLGQGGDAKFAYDTVDAGRGTVVKTVSTSGPVRALVTVSIGSQLSGQISKLNVDFNSEVKEGDILAELDAKTYASRVAQANADLSAAKAQLANQEAALQKAEAVVRNNELSLERQKMLAAKGVSAQSALDNATRDLEVGKADVAVARAQIENAKATIAQRQAQRDQAQIDLDRTTIRSPIKGTVISRTVDMGQTVAASLQAPELFKIAQDLRMIQIEAQVNEADVGIVAEGNPVTFVVDAYPDRKFDGQVTQVRLAATELQSVVTYTVIIEARNDDRRLFPGMTANVQIETAKRENVLRVPNDALRFKPKGEAAQVQGKQGGRDEDRAGSRADRMARMTERIIDELQLTETQAEVLRAETAKMAEERRQRSAEDGQAPRGGPTSFMPGPPRVEGEEAGAARGRMIGRLQQVLTPVLTEEQRVKFDAWKRGRESTRPGAVWVLAGDGKLQSRRVLTGVVDEQFTEVIGGALKEGERVVTRARTVTQ